MTDELNLVPTNNLEKHLDNILRAASGEEPQYDLAPNWRVEQYLAAIAAALASGGGGAYDFVVTFSGTTSEENAAVDKTLQEINEAFLAGKTIKLRYVTSDGDGSVIFELQKMYYGANDGRITTLVGAYSDYGRCAIHCMMDDHGNLHVEYQEL